MSASSKENIVPPLVSIIVPNYNHSKFLKERLNSIFNQTYTDFEVILLDDASTDNSLEILEEYRCAERIAHFVVNKVNSGSPFEQWRKGLDLAQGEYIWIAESDDFCSINFLQRCMHTLLSNESDLVYSDSKLVDGEGVISKLTYNETSLKELHDTRWASDFTVAGIEELTKYYIKKTTMPNASGVVFKKSLVVLAPWKEILRMKLVGDKLFWASLLIHSDISYIAQPLNFHRFHNQTQRHSVNLLDWYFEHAYFFERITRLSNKTELVAQQRIIMKTKTRLLTNYSLNVFLVIPYLWKLLGRFPLVGLKLIFVDLPPSYVRTICNRFFAKRDI